MIKSSEWKAIAIAVTVACVSMILLAVDAGLDLNIGELSKRLETAQASFVDPMGQYQLALAIPAWTREKTFAEQQMPVQPVLSASR